MTIAGQVAQLGSGPLTEAGLREHIWPLFTRTRAWGEASGRIYLANHSLGRPLDQTAADIREGVDLWYDRLDEAWSSDGWMGEAARFRAAIAHLIGLPRADAVVPKTSAGQGLRAVLNSFPVERPIRVVSTRAEFDSLDFILKAYWEAGRAEIRWIEPTAGTNRVPLYEADAIAAAISEDFDLLAISHTAFVTGQILPGLPEAIRRARERGALTLVDAYHGVGVVPIDFMALAADFMVGGSYKYLRGGPGACWLAIHPRILEASRTTLDTGWFAKADTFGYERSEAALRASGGDGWLESTPPVLGFYQARAGLELMAGLGVDRLRAYRQGQLAILRAGLDPLGGYLPADPDTFGAFALLPHEDAPSVAHRLATAGVTVDARGSCVRFGPDLLNPESELRAAVGIAA